MTGKIDCHVCNWLNADDEQNCVNPKCGFTLKYAKGYSVGISDEEARQYKKELEKAKNKYITLINNQSIKLTPEILKKDMFETTVEYIERINTTSGIIGQAILKDYNIDKELFLVEIDINQVLKNTFIKYNKKVFYLNISRNYAKTMFTSSSCYDLYCDLEFRNEYIDIVSLYIQFNNLNYKFNITSLQQIDLKEIVVDWDTGLFWQDDESVGIVEMNWADAEKYAKSLRLAGYNDWRLPTIGELRSIVDKKKSPTIKDCFKIAVSDYYWSSSNAVHDSRYAWYVFFNYGTTYDTGNKSNKHYVRCVRDSK